MSSCEKCEVASPDKESDSVVRCAKEEYISKELSPASHSSTPVDSPAFGNISATGNHTPHCGDTTASSQEPSPCHADDEMCQNPEPPKELAELIDADNIGGTVFSKHWLFSTLMKLLQAVECDDGRDSKDGTESTTDGQYVDLDEGLQDNLCKLWDMSMNPEVVTFLMEFKAIELLTGVIAKSRAPRATEICVGILGNMACDDEVCSQINENKRLLELVLLLLETPDAPTLIETMRLLLVCVSSTKSAGSCISLLKEMTHVFPSILFILQSSTNCTLLKNTAELVDKLMEVDEELCAQWSSADLVLAVMEAVKQTGSDDRGVLETFIHIFQLISTCESGVQALVSYAGEVSVLVQGHLLHICTDDIVAVNGRENVIGSMLSVLDVVFTSWPEHRCLLMSDFQLVRCIAKIVEAVYPKLRHQPIMPLTPRRRRRQSIGESSQQSNADSSEDESSSADGPASVDDNLKNKLPCGHSGTDSNTPASDSSFSEKDETKESSDSGRDEYSTKMVEMLFEVIQTLLVNLINVLDSLPVGGKTDDKEVKSESEMDKDHCWSEAKSATVPSCLMYLNTLCDRRRLECLIHTLDSVRNERLVDKLHGIARRHDLHRLNRIISDVTRLCTHH